MSFGTEAKQEGNGGGTASVDGGTPCGGRRLQVGAEQRQITTQASACLLSAILEGDNDEVESVLNSTAPIVMTPNSMFTLYDVPDGTDVDGLIPELYIFDSEMETETDGDVGPFYIPVPDHEGTNQFFTTEADEADLQKQQELNFEKEESQAGVSQATGAQDAQIQMLERGSVRDQFHPPGFVYNGSSEDSGDSEGLPALASGAISMSSEMENEGGREGSMEQDGKSTSMSTTPSTTPPAVQNSGPDRGPSLLLSTFATDISEGAYAAHMMDVMSGGHEDAQTLANRGIGANSRDSRGRTVLMKASMGGNVEFVNALINTSTNFDLQDKAGCTALMWAAVSGQEDIVSLLLEKHAQVDIRNKHGSTALIMAAMNGKLAIVKTLMTSSPNIDVQDKFGRTALMKAAMNGKLEVVNVLISGGANVDVQDQSGETVLMKMAMVGNIEIASRVISCNAELDLQDENGQSAVMKAAVFGRTTIVNSLITGGAALNLRDKSGETALMHASAEGCVDIVDALITAGAGMDDVDKAGRTTLMLASIDGHIDVVNLLISCGANVHLRDKSGRTAYHHAVKRGHRDIARVLHREGAYQDIERAQYGGVLSPRRRGASRQEIEDHPSGVSDPQRVMLSPPRPARRPTGDVIRSVGDGPAALRAADRRRSRFGSTGALPDVSNSVASDDSTWSRGSRGSRGDARLRNGNTARLREQAVPEEVVEEEEEEEEHKTRLGALWRLGRLLKRATSLRKG